MWERALRIAAIRNGDPLPEPPPADLTCPRPSLCGAEGDSPPGISCPEPASYECTEPQTVAEFGAPVALDGSCGAAVVQGCIPASGTVFGVGFSDVTCSAVDAARNSTACDFGVTIQDTALPALAVPGAITGVECTSPQGAPVELGQATASDLCDTTPTIAAMPPRCTRSASVRSPGLPAQPPATAIPPDSR